MNYAVIIPCFNSGPQLMKTVASALEQRLPPAEIICVDDQSADDTWANIQKLERETGGIVRGLQRDGNRGVTGREMGINSSSSEWMAILDHDDIWFPNKMERLSILAKNSRFLCSSFYDETEDDPTTRIQITEGRVLTCNDPFKALFHRPAIAASTVVIHRSVFEECGNFSSDPETRWVGDVDMWLRIARRGIAPAYDPEPLTIRRIHGSNMSRDLTMTMRALTNVFEGYRRRDPEAVERAGGEIAVRRSIHWRRLAMSAEFFRLGRPDEALSELNTVRAEARWDPRLTPLWWRLGWRTPEGDQARQSILRASKKLRQWCRELVHDPPE